MASVRPVQELAGRMDLYFSGRVPLLDSIGKRGESLDFLQHCMRAIVMESGDGALRLVDDVGVAAIRMKGKMAGAGPGFHGNRWWLVGDQCAVCRVETIDQ